MPSGNRLFLGLFVLAVFAAVAAVAWLMVSGSPSAEPGAKTGTTPPAVKGPGAKPDRKKDPPKPGDRPKQQRPKVVHEILGEVRGPDDAPVPGASVVLLSGAVKEAVADVPSAGEAEKIPAESLRELFALEPGEAENCAVYSGIPALPEGVPAVPRTLRSVVTDEAGKFRIEAPGKGPYRLEAGKEGIGSAVAAEVMAGPTPQLLRLGAAVVLKGRVLGAPAGAPVAGAVVLVRSGRGVKGATTAADGTFAVADLVPGKYSVVAGAAGYAPTTLPAVEAPGAAPVDILLGNGFAVRVSVVKKEYPAPGQRVARAATPSSPAEGALVALYHPATDTYRSGTTGPDGIARIDRLGTGVWRIAARVEGHGLGICREVRFLPGGNPEESREVRVYPLVETPVLVTDESGAPLRNAKVYGGGLDDEWDERHSRLVGTTDQDGKLRYAFDDAVPWKAAIWVVPEGGGAATKVAPEEPTGTEEVKAIVRPGRVLQGAVTDMKGKPLAGAKVMVMVLDDEHDVDVSLSAYADAEGKYRFPSLPFGEVTLEAEHGDEWDTIDIEDTVRDNPLVRDILLKTDE
jgi:hypothetical protein